MKKTLGILIVAMIVMVSCKNNTSQSTKVDTHEEMEHKADHDNSSNHDQTLHLNNGKKWTVNDATHVGMTNIKGLLTDYVKNNKTDHVALAASMSKESSLLISKCDMVGPDHDQLHIILMPILESIDGIKNSSSAQPIMDLSVHLSDYFDHFQTAK